MSSAAPAPSPSELEPLQTKADLVRFLAARGLEHTGRLGAEVLLPFVPERERASLRYVLGRGGLAELATVQGVSSFGYALAHAPRIRAVLPRAARAFLEQEAKDLQLAREEAMGRAEVDETHRHRALLEPLATLRRAHPAHVPPRLEAALIEGDLASTPELPGFTWTDDRPFLPEGRAVPQAPRVSLTVTPKEARARCSLCTGLCLHTLAATDAALRLLRSGSQAAGAVAAELTQPPWARALAALDRALEDAVPEEDVLVTWRLHVDRGQEGVTVAPYLHRRGRKGYGAGARISPAALLRRYGPSLGDPDERIARHAERDLGYAGQATLDALVDHPRVFLEHNPEAHVTVERAKVGLLADHRGDHVALCAALDGAPLPQPWARRLTGDTGRPLFLFEEEARRLTLLCVPREVLATLDALSRFGNAFPKESHAALVEKLSALSAKVPVAMPRSVVGEEVPPSPRWVLRLEVRPDGRVGLELRVRPLPESAAFLPAEGARDVHVRRDGDPVHATRSFEEEARTARALADRLPLTGSEAPSPHTWVLPEAQAALALLSEVGAWPEAERPSLEWVGQPVRVAGRAGTGALKVVLEKRRDWFGVKGGLTIEGERVSLAVLLDAARRKARYVRASESTYIEVGEALRRHLEALSDHAWRSPHGVELGPSAAEALQALRDDGAHLDADAAWQELTQRIFAAKARTPRVPRGLRATLRDYQVEGFRWLSRLASWGAGAVLADDMGLGKTVQALALLLERAKLGPQLVVAPTSVGFNWVEEARRFAPSLRLHVFAESGDRGGTLEALGPRDVLVASYGLLARDRVRLGGVRFSTIVYDEAQALKNVQTQRAKAARELEGDFKVALSGTPLENHLGELWSLYRIVFPGLLGSWDAFRDRFATPIEKGLDPTAAPALARVLQPFLLRRTKSQVARELPPRTELQLKVVLSPKEWQLYEDARLAALSDLETPREKLKEQQRRIEVLAALTRLRLLASHPRLYDPRSKVASSKLERLVELLEELRAEGHRALVFSQFTSHLALVREVLDQQGMPYLYLDGQTPARERARRVQAFQEGDVPFFLISLKAGGFGLNLTGADNAIHLDPWWNPAVEDQASDRAHRIGQARPVTVYRLVAKGTIEEQILSLHEDKRRLVTGVLEGKDQAGRLSTRELLALLSRAPSGAEAARASTRTRH